MGAIEFVLIAIALVIIQQAFWMLQVHRLINKLMSRDFHEYVQSKNLKPVPPKKEVAEGRILLPNDELGVLDSLI